MNWKYDQNKLKDFCDKNDIEFTEVRDCNKIVFLCPKIPDLSIQKNLAGMIPDTAICEFIKSPKLSTADTMSVLCKEIGFVGQMYEKEGILTITSAIEIAPDDSFWTDMVNILKKDSYFKGWNITMGDKTVTEKDLIQIKKGDRDHRPTPDEIMDLGITLNKSESFDDIFKELFGEAN